jgi:hypothetical protein
VPLRANNLANDFAVWPKALRVSLQLEEASSQSRTKVKCDYEDLCKYWPPAAGEIPINIEKNYIIFYWAVGWGGGFNGDSRNHFLLTLKKTLLPPSPHPPPPRVPRVVPILLCVCPVCPVWFLYSSGCALGVTRVCPVCPGCALGVCPVCAPCALGVPWHPHPTPHTPPRDSCRKWANAPKSLFFIWVVGWGGGFSGDSCRKLANAPK